MSLEVTLQLVVLKKFWGWFVRLLTDREFRKAWRHNLSVLKNWRPDPKPVIVFFFLVFGVCAAWFLLARAAPSAAADTVILIPEVGGNAEANDQSIIAAAIDHNIRRTPNLTAKKVKTRKSDRQLSQWDDPDLLEKESRGLGRELGVDMVLQAKRVGDKLVLSVVIVHCAEFPSKVIFLDEVDRRQLHSLSTHPAIIAIVSLLKVNLSVWFLDQGQYKNAAIHLTDTLTDSNLVLPHGSPSQDSLKHALEAGARGAGQPRGPYNTRPRSRGDRGSNRSAPTRFSAGPVEASAVSGDCCPRME